MSNICHEIQRNIYYLWKSANDNLYSYIIIYYTIHNTYIIIY